MDVVWIGGGILLLLFGGDWLVRGAVALASRFGLSPMVIGLTLVGFGTSMPELAASLDAALSGAPDIAIGNVVGSNIANILLILGVSALISPIGVSRSEIKRDGAVLMAATLASLTIFLGGEIGRAAGAAGLALLALYVLLTVRSGNVVPEVLAPDHTLPLPVWHAAGMAVMGLGAVIAGAGLLVDGATGFARMSGVSEAAIGLTVVAVGTSLPELATSVMAARRGQSAVALGNVIGSNIFNLLGILGATALATPVPVAARFLYPDGLVMLAATAALIWVAMSGSRISRAEGAVLTSAYVGYMTLFALGQ